MRLLTEQVQALEVEVAEETVAKTRLERQLERQILQRSTLAASLVTVQTESGVSTTAARNRAMNPPSAPLGNNGQPMDSAIQSLVERRRSSGKFSTSKQPTIEASVSTRGEAVEERDSSRREPKRSSSTKRSSSSSAAVVSTDPESADQHGDPELLRDPTTKLARLRNKIAAHAHSQNGGKGAASTGIEGGSLAAYLPTAANEKARSHPRDSDPELDASTASAAPPLRLQDLLHH